MATRQSISLPVIEKKRRRRAGPAEWEQRLLDGAERSPSGCWLFGGRSERYGKVTLTIGDTKVTERTHRLSYMLFCGPIAAGLFVCHKCDTPGCVRPDHLFLGTAADNAKDMRAKGRSLCGEKNHRHARPEIRQRGERVGSAKLTEEQVRDIVRRVEAGESQADLSREYGVSSGAVSLIVQRKNWGHLWGLPIAAKPRFKGRS